MNERMWWLAVTREAHSALVPGHVIPDNSVTVLSIISRWHTLQSNNAKRLYDRFRETVDDSMPMYQMW